MADKSSAQIEREIDETRQHADQVLRTLEHRLTPETMISDAVTYLRTGSGAQMVDNLRAAVVANPVPLVLVAAGIGWLLYESSRRPMRPSYTRRMRHWGRAQMEHHTHLDQPETGRVSAPPSAEALVGSEKTGKSAAESAQAFMRDDPGMASSSGKRGQPDELGIGRERNAGDGAMGMDSRHASVIPENRPASELERHLQQPAAAGTAGPPVTQDEKSPLLGPDGRPLHREDRPLH